MNYWINEEHVMVEHEGENEEHVILGESGFYETDAATLGELFRNLRKRFGRCESKVYRDGKDGSPRAVGWVFQKRIKKYEYLEGEPHLCEQWVTVLKSEPRVVYDYAEVG